MTLMNLHVQHWELCETCGFRKTIDQEEAETYKARECPACSYLGGPIHYSWKQRNDKRRSTRCTTKEFS